jgi:hypothetical protein
MLCLLCEVGGMPYICCNINSIKKPTVNCKSRATEAAMLRLGTIYIQT